MRAAGTSWGKAQREAPWALATSLGRAEARIEDGAGDDAGSEGGEQDKCAFCLVVLIAHLPYAVPLCPTSVLFAQWCDDHHASSSISPNFNRHELDTVWSCCVILFHFKIVDNKYSLFFELILFNHNNLRTSTILCL
jgi:Fe-S-cluster-containing dehydrogenase component